MEILSLQNILSWTVQSAAIIFTGAAMTALFRLRHPQSHLGFCYLLLFACALLPFIQPWRYPVLSTEDVSAAPVSTVVHDESNAAFSAARDWNATAIYILCAGAIVKLGWFLAGLLRLGRYRYTAIPLRPVPDSLISARRLVRRDALVCITPDNPGPVTFGWRRPIIILPESFLVLGEDEQCAILCHELLHVKRGDWIVNLFEELIGAVLWFHPGFWYLLAQTRLAREQVVDAEVIRLTHAPDPYVDALLAIAGADLKAGPASAASLLQRGHLARRLRLLLSDGTTTSFRLMLSYFMIGCVLSGTGLFAHNAFPLIGAPRGEAAERPQVEQEPAASPPRVRRTSMEGVFRTGGDVTAPTARTQVQPQYSDTARQNRIQGSVVVQGIVETDGRVSVLKVIQSLDPQLDQNAVRAFEQWRFEPGRLHDRPVPVEILAEIHFSLK